MARIVGSGQAAEKFEVLIGELEQRRDWVYDYIMTSPAVSKVHPAELADGALRYIVPKGKALRPTLLLLACGATGGKETSAVPAAAAVEVYHTWTLVHDDIIDQDDVRRGSATVHAAFQQYFADRFGGTAEESRHYGVSMAILAGDVQHGWALSLLCDLTRDAKIPTQLVVELIRELSLDTLLDLAGGETLDVAYPKVGWDNVQESDVINMLRMKTASLFRFSGRAGAMIGRGEFCPDDPYTGALSQFAELCGIGFQLRDDILGIIGNTTQTGKAVGADLREGKATTIVLHGLRNASVREKALLLSVLGNRHSTERQLADACNLLRELGSIDYTQALANDFLSLALPHLDMLPRNRHRSLLDEWARYLVERDS